jgi:hypothetical protein
MTRKAQREKENGRMGDQLRGGVVIEAAPKREFEIIDYTEEGGIPCYGALVFVNGARMGPMTFGAPTQPMGVTICWWPSKRMLREFLAIYGWQERVPAASTVIQAPR